MTYRQEVNDIRSMFKLLSSDNIITDRVVLQQVKSVANTIIGQALNKRKYWQSPNLFSFLPCLEMEQIPLFECCDYTGERMVAISKKKLPKILDGTFGLAVQGVFGIDGSIRFSETNPNRYANLLRLNLPKDNKFFWVRSDGRVVVTNENTEALNMYAYFSDFIPNDLLLPTKNCDCKSKPDISDLCANPLDQKFPFMDERLNDLNQQVYKNLLATYFNSGYDKTSDNKDDTSK